jgi:multidrug efflux pump subunit AcrA (membrane-fusion protein)
MWLSDFLTTINPFTYRKEHREIMTALENLGDRITQLNNAITAETEQQRAKVAQLQAEIDALKAAGADTAGIQAIADQLGESIDRVKAIVPDDAPQTNEA